MNIVCSQINTVLLAAGQIFNGQMSGTLPIMWKNAHCMLFCCALLLSEM